MQHSSHTNIFQKTTQKFITQNGSLDMKHKEQDQCSKYDDYIMVIRYHTVMTSNIYIKSVLDVYIVLYVWFSQTYVYHIIIVI